MRTKTRMWILGVMAITLIGAVPAMAASQMPEIAKKAGCAMCHQIEGKLIGPAFAWVADKYKDDKEAGRKAIVNQIANGSRGQWTRYTGGVIMPPYGAQTTEAQRNELADYILGLDPIAPPN
jgi:cytochrome c